MSNSGVVLRDKENSIIYKSLKPGTDDIVMNVSDRFVLMKELSWSDMQKIAQRYCDEHDFIMREMFLAPAKMVAPQVAVSRVSNGGSEEMVRNLDAPYALRLNYIRVGSVPKPEFASAGSIRRAVEDAGLYPVGGKYASTHWGILDEPYEVQRHVMASMLSPPALRVMSWSTAASGLTRVASCRIEEALAASGSTMEFLQRVSDPVLSWLQDDYKANIKGNADTRPERPLLFAWFMIWLAERDICLFPSSGIRRATELIPIFWAPFRIGLVPDHARDGLLERIDMLARLCMPSKFSDKRRPGRTAELYETTRSGLAALRYVSTWRSPDQLSADFLAHARSLDTGTSRIRGVLIGKIWDTSKHDVPMDRTQLHAEEAKIRANKRRPRGQLGRAWAWVEDPDYKPSPTERYYAKGCDAGSNLRSHLAELRMLLPKLAKKELSNWTTPLSVWLMYLSSLSDEAVPPRLLDIDRSKHIDKPGDPSARTLRDFLVKQALPASNILHANVYLKLAAAWDAAYDLAGPDHRPMTRVCPIQPRFDAPKTKQANRGRTHRRPLDEEILLFVANENRKNNFEFSRTRKNKPLSGRYIDFRLVRDPDSGETRYEWFPGLAVLMDGMFNVCLRKKQWRYLDSGEGDELVLDIDTLELRRNTLSTATRSRNQAFFQVSNTSLLEHKPVLGMWINTSKTGKPYGIPWLPMDLARNVKSLIDWQMRYNPLTSPLPDRDYHARNALVEDRFSEDVYPLFRDPANISGQPIDEGTLHGYFVALLEHCEREFNRATGRHLSFFRDEVVGDGEGREVARRKPIIDLHTLRVTGVTILIENGVPLEIVQLLVGHASVAMTMYYHVLDLRRVHEEMMCWMEARAPKLRRLESITSEELATLGSRFLRNRTEDHQLGRAQFMDLVAQRNPGWDYRYHGICAGGDCRYGGPPERAGGDGTPLWRESACSLCRYRITGAPWLVGLVHHVNQLWWELRQAGAEIAELQLRRDALEDAGSSVKSILGDMERAKIKRDFLLEEWIAEVNYVNQAKADLDEWVRYCEDAEEGAEVGSRAPAVFRAPLGQEGVKAQLSMVHELSQLTELVRGARILESAILPRGILEDRNAILLDIARASDLDHVFLRLSTSDARKTLDLFADVVLDAVGSDPDKVQALVEGRTSLRDMPELEARLLEILPNTSEMRGLLARSRAS